MRKTMTAMTAAIVAAAAVPAAAPAATVTITGDTGTPVTLTPGAPASLRQMHAEVNVALGGTERAFALAVAGPVAPAASPRKCGTSNIPWGVDYQGNGTYTITVTTYTNTTCTTGAQATSYSVAINAGVALTAPSGPVLTRQPNSVVGNTLQIPVALNPGALTHELRIALGGVPAPDGSISGPSKEVFADAATGTAAVRLDAPGKYLMVGRATGYTGGAGQFFSPWSAPITIRAFAPFDFIAAPSCVDCRGPRYKSAAGCASSPPAARSGSSSRAGARAAGSARSARRGSATACSRRSSRSAGPGSTARGTSSGAARPPRPAR